SFWRLPVALGELGPEPAGVTADRVAAEQPEAPVCAGHPQLQQMLALEDAHMGALAQREALVGQRPAQARAVELPFGNRRSSPAPKIALDHRRDQSADCGKADEPQPYGHGP